MNDIKSNDIKSLALTRRDLLCGAAASSAALPLALHAASKDEISLQSWSLNRSYFAGYWKNLDLPRLMREKLGLSVLEHVNQFFDLPTLAYLRRFRQSCADYGIRCALIMVDQEDPMAGRDANARAEAVTAHRKWVDIAHFLGCTSIRCNIRSEDEKDWQNDRDYVKRGAESFRKLLEYAAGSGVTILVENHGGASSNAEILTSLVKEVNHPSFGLLVDFSNTNPGDDRYEVIRRLIPHARSISVKVDPRWDVDKLIDICLQANYHGCWGIESMPHPKYRDRNAQFTPEQCFELDRETVFEVKSVIERRVFRQGRAS